MRDTYFHPGEFLRDELHERGMSIAEFARASNLSPMLVKRILDCQAGVEPGTAAAFARALGTSAKTWLKLQALYEGRMTDG